MPCPLASLLCALRCLPRRVLPWTNSNFKNLHLSIALSLPLFCALPRTLRSRFARPVLTRNNSPSALYLQGSPSPRAERPKPLWRTPLVLLHKCQPFRTPRLATTSYLSRIQDCHLRQVSKLRPLFRLLQPLRIRLLPDPSRIHLKLTRRCLHHRFLSAYLPRER